MGKKGERQEGGCEDGYRDLMAAVVMQQVADVQDTKMPKRPALWLKDPKCRYKYKQRCNAIRHQCEAARRYIFTNDPESENYVFGFKFILKHMNIDPEKARAAIRKTLPKISGSNNLTSEK